jgi:ribonuclease Z
MLTITLLGTGSPLPDPHRAGPSTLVSGGGEHFLVDAGRGVLMRLAAAGVGVNQLTAVLVTHLHSDHLTDLSDVITTQWITSFTPTPLHIVGPPGTAGVVNHLLEALAPDIRYRIAHHGDLTLEPLVEVTEVTDEHGVLPGTPGRTTIAVAPTDHRPVEPSVAFRLEHAGASVVVAGDTVPCAGLDALCRGADALVHTVIRKDVIEQIPVQRLRDTLDYHSSPVEAAATAERAGVGTLALTHYVPAFAPGDEVTREQWRALAAASFGGTIEVGDDLHRIDVHPRPNRPS